MTTEISPFQEIYDLGDLGRGTADLRITTTDDDRARIARWADVQAVEAFAATMVLRKHAANSFSLDAELTADVVQDCVVTLEPLRSHIERHIHRELHLAPSLRHRSDTTIALSQHARGDDEAPEEIDSLDYDLAGPLLEEFASLPSTPIPALRVWNLPHRSRPESPKPSPKAPSRS